MSEVNQHGLQRAIPETVKREVRQRCGFGCVVCGSAVVQYHHFSPKFADAREHSPDGITLLCGLHHQEAGNWLPDEEVAARNAAPFCTGTGAHRTIRVTRPLYIVAGTAIFEGPGDLISLNDEVVLGISEEDGRIILDATFYSSTGAPNLQIVQNELTVRSGAWDAQFIGSRAVIRSGPNEVALSFSVTSSNCIYFEKLDYICESTRVVFRPDRFEIWNKNGNVIDGEFLLYCRGGILLGREGPKLKQLALTPFNSARFIELARVGQIDALLAEAFRNK